MHDQHAVGEQLTLEWTFVNASSGALANPSAIAVTITDGAVVTNKVIGDLTLVATGRYSYDYTPASTGVLEYRAVASGNGVSADVTEYVVIGAPSVDGPCDLWVGPVDVFDCKPASSTETAARDYAFAADCAAAASRILFTLSNRRYPGICKETVRPCRRSRWNPTPAGWHSSWGSCGCDSPTGCACSGVDEIRLGGRYPILGIQRIRIDGTTLAASAYDVHDHNYLVRLDGDSWPGSQDLSNDPASDPETFDVTYFYGRTVPEEGVLAAKRLASELYSTCTGGPCGLPKRVQNITRQDVSMSFIDPMEFLDQGRTGLYEVDLFLAAEEHGRRNLGTVVATPGLLAQNRRG